MKSILLIGLGRFGRHTAMKLQELGHQVMAVDKSEEQTEAVLPYVTAALIGDSTNPAFLSTLGVESYDLCIVSIGDDFQSALETTSLLKDAGAKFIVSRASRGLHEKLLRNNGADAVVYPEKQLAEWTAICYSSDYILDYITVNETFAVYEIHTPEKWVGRTLLELNIRRRFQINVIAVKRGGELQLDVDPDAPLLREETLLVIGRESDVQKVLK
ncbi:MAG: TrkA family potassium uptake protein [Oscillospiraceae bacterium]|nr:TrkA family potassium uptake protein [Oscillospiraceae bacterium]